MTAEPRGARRGRAMSKFFERSPGNYEVITDVHAECKERLGETQANLAKYGRHNATCPAHPQIVTGVVGYPLPELETGPCDCGFAVALAPTCKRGHPRSEFGLWQTRLSRSNPNPYWQCRACIEAYRAADREGTRARAQERKAAALGTKGAGEQARTDDGDET